jgi:hypothetical protein
MRAFFWFVAAIVLSLLIATALAYPAYVLIHPLHGVWRFDKIASRLFDVLLLGFIVLVLKRLQLRGAAAWGWQVPAARGRRQFTLGVILGIASMLPVSVAMVLLGVRPLDPQLNLPMLGSALIAGVGSGLVVGLLEETLFRGLIQGAVIQHSGRVVAGVVSVSALFAALHFLASVHIPHEAVTPASGLVLLSGTLAELSHPLNIVDSFLALFGVGLITGIARQWTGNILLAAGLHAGWVFVMRTTIGITLLPENSPHGWLLSRHDGYTGWLVVFFIVGMLTIGYAAKRSIRTLLRAT